MPKSKTIYLCSGCGARHLKWQGQCPDCGAWNSLAASSGGDARRGAGLERPHLAGTVVLTELPSVAATTAPRVSTGLGEFDRVLGGGLVPGSAVLVGGDPGIGKSTLLLAVLTNLSRTQPGCYVTGEESIEQIALRAARLGVADSPLQLIADNSLEAIVATLKQQRPQAVVIDSIQTLYSDALDSAPGSVSQVRDCASTLVRLAKTEGIAVFLIGHVTKEGTLAGPRVLEHMVDTVLYFESDSGSRFRILRTMKNRFGAANEMGVFAMTETGFKEVRNPSAIFLAKRPAPVSGSAVMVTREGSRPLLVEVQALVDDTSIGHPRRLAQGMETQRLSLLLAVLHRHGGTALGDRDVFVNVVGGLRISETALDLPVALAILSSVRNRPLPEGLVVFGELGLTGEVRPVPFGEERLAAASKQGFKTALIPKANVPKHSAGIEVVGVEGLADAIDWVDATG